MFRDEQVGQECVAPFGGEADALTGANRSERSFNMARGFFSGILWGGTVGLGVSAVASVLAPMPIPPEVADVAPEAVTAPDRVADVSAGKASSTPDRAPVKAQVAPQAELPKADTIVALNTDATETVAQPQAGNAAALETPAEAAGSVGLALASDAPVIPKPQASAPLEPQPVDTVAIDTDPAAPPPPSKEKIAGSFDAPTQPAAETYLDAEEGTISPAPVSEVALAVVAPQAPVTPVTAGTTQGLADSTVTAPPAQATQASAETEKFQVVALDLPLALVAPEAVTTPAAAEVVGPAVQAPNVAPSDAPPLVAEDTTESIVVAENPPPTPVVQEPVAVTPKPVSLTVESTPETPEPISLATEIAPVTPEVLTQTPEPVGVTPEPVSLTTEPAPVTPEPVSLTTEPAPETPEPVSLTTEPAPETPELVTLAPEPAPEAPEPVTVLAQAQTTQTDTQQNAPEESAAEQGASGVVVRRAIGTPAGSLTDRTNGVIVNRLGNQSAQPQEAEPEPEAVVTEASVPGDLPVVKRFAEAFENVDGKPLMSIVLIDDGSSTLAGADGIDALSEFPYTLSFAVDSGLKDAADRMAIYRAAGFEVLAMVDLPEGALPSDAEIALSVVLPAMDEVVGVLEGTKGGLQGSRDVADQVTAILAQSGHGLLTQDNGLNTMPKLALKEGVPADPIFRDFDSKGQTSRVIRRFLDQAAFRAGQEGAVVMLGRLRPETVSALSLWGLQDRAGQVALAPISAVLTRER